MKILTRKEYDQVKSALRLAAIYLQENADEDSPIREVRLALQIMSTSPAIHSRCATA